MTGSDIYSSSLQFLQIFLHILLHILQELRTVDNLDFMAQSQEEPASPNIGTQVGVQDPEVALTLDIGHGQRVFLQQQVLGHHGHFPRDVANGGPDHPEDVHSLALVLLLCGPALLLHFNAADAVDLEDFVLLVFQVVGADVDVVGGKAVGLHVAVADCMAVTGLIALQDDFLLLFGCIPEVFHVGGIAPEVAKLLDGGGVIDHGQLLFDALLQGVGGDDGLDDGVDQGGFFFGEVQQPVEVRHVSGDLLYLVGVGVEFCDREASCLESINVAVDGAVRHVQMFGEFINGVVDVAGHHQHHAQHAFYFGLVHGASSFRGNPLLKENLAFLLLSYFFRLTVPD